MQHAAIFDDFGLFQGPFDMKNPTALRAYPGMKGEDSRLKTYRRLALAYATHGPVVVCLSQRRRHPRADGLFPRGRYGGSASPARRRGTSDRVLLNCVNFENRSQKVEVRVTMPQRAISGPCVSEPARHTPRHATT